MKREGANTKFKGYRGLTDCLNFRQLRPLLGLVLSSALALPALAASRGSSTDVNSSDYLNGRGANCYQELGNIEYSVLKGVFLTHQALREKPGATDFSALLELTDKVTGYTTLSQEQKASILGAAFSDYEKSRALRTERYLNLVGANGVADAAALEIMDQLDKESIQIAQQQNGGRLSLEQKEQVALNLFLTRQALGMIALARAPAIGKIKDSGMLNTATGEITVAANIDFSEPEMVQAFDVLYPQQMEALRQPWRMVVEMGGQVFCNMCKTGMTIAQRHEPGFWTRPENWARIHNVGKYQELIQKKYEVVAATLKEAMQSSREATHWTQFMFWHGNELTPEQSAALRAMERFYAATQDLGEIASTELRDELRRQTHIVQQLTSDNIEAGSQQAISNIKKAMVATAIAPLAITGAPLLFAGGSVVAVIGGVAAGAGVVGSLTTMSYEVVKSVGRGNGLGCAVGKTLTDQGPQAAFSLWVSMATAGLGSVLNSSGSAVRAMGVARALNGQPVNPELIRNAAAALDYLQKAMNVTHLAEVSQVAGIGFTGLRVYTEFKNAKIAYFKFKSASERATLARAQGLQMNNPMLLADADRLKQESQEELVMTMRKAVVVLAQVHGLTLTVDKVYQHYINGTVPISASALQLGRGINVIVR